MYISTIVKKVKNVTSLSWISLSNFGSSDLSFSTDVASLETACNKEKTFALNANYKFTINSKFT